jgi:subtilisin family serine protease
MNVIAIAFLSIVMISTSLMASANPAYDTPSYPYAQSRLVPDQYIIIFKKNVSNPQAEASNIVRANKGELIHNYQYAIKGFSARLPSAALSAISKNPNVVSIEQVQTVSLIATQTSPTWGLDRIDQVSLPLDQNYVYNATGLGVKAFIIDTGIRTDHVEFNNNRIDVGNGFSAFGDNNTIDCQGHGTHVAGTVGGAVYGVAKEVSLVPVRVLDCNGSGTTSGVVAGVDHVARYKDLNPTVPAVANMSLGGGASSAIDAAVKGAVDKGVVMVVAAGNDNANACNYSPAREPSAITVGATASNDARASYSNFGICLDLFAPGSGITSAYYNSSTDLAIMSGTSMASPHVAGVAALILQSNPTAKPSAIRNFLVDLGTPNKVSSPGTNSPNILLYSVASGSPMEQEVKIRTISASSAKSGKNWVANVTVSVNRVKQDRSFAESIAGAIVEGAYLVNGRFDNVKCTTGTNGSCILRSPTYGSSVVSTTFTVNSVTHSGSKYTGCAVNCTGLVINRPR